jgi:hypothetical protein
MCGELALEEAMDLSQDRVLNKKLSRYSDDLLLYNRRIMVRL